MFPDKTVKVDEKGIPYYPEYKDHVASLILNRNSVKYSPNFSSHHSNVDQWLDGTIYIDVQQDDIDRWFAWHPDNKFKTVLYERIGFDKRRWDYSNVLTDADVTAAFSRNSRRR
jgi:hypothetical protein